MDDKSRVWHYGLIAETWAEFNADTPELPFLKKQIESYGQPVLDLACGTGRLLLPLMRAGTDIDGCDISGDMLGLLDEKAKGEGLSPRLYEQPMHELDLPRKYKTIYICGSFGLAGSRQLDQETLLRCLNHLEDGGALVFNIYPEYADTKSWKDWLKEHREAMPEPWPEEGRRRTTSDGTEYITMSRMTSVDPLEQSYTREMRVEKWRYGTLIAQEERTLRGQMHFRNEVELMLKLVGFGKIEVHDYYTDEEAAADSGEIVFIARR
jgi:SAM-dependent methyltransferase